MDVLTHSLAIIVSSGVTLFLVLKFRKPTTVNEYKGTFKNKVRGKNNTQEVSQTFEINPEMSNKEIRQTVRSCKNARE